MSWIDRISARISASRSRDADVGGPGDVKSAMNIVRALGARFFRSREHWIQAQGERHLLLRQSIDAGVFVAETVVYPLLNLCTPALTDDAVAQIYETQSAVRMLVRSGKGAVQRIRVTIMYSESRFPSKHRHPSESQQ